MSPADILLCSIFTLALPLGQMLFKWAAIYNARLSGPPVMRLLLNVPLIAAFAWYGVSALLWKTKILMKK